jgi:hypothetical protein
VEIQLDRDPTTKCELIARDMPVMYAFSGLGVVDEECTVRK